MFESLKSRMFLDESKKISEESLWMLTEDAEQIEDDDIEAVIDGYDGDITSKPLDDEKEIEELINRIPDDNDIQSEAAWLESVINEGDEEEINNDSVSAANIAGETAPYSYQNDDLDIDIV